MILRAAQCEARGAAEENINTEPCYEQDTE